MNNKTRSTQIIYWQIFWYFNLNILGVSMLADRNTRLCIKLSEKLFAWALKNVSVINACINVASIPKHIETGITNIILIISRHKFLLKSFVCFVFKLLFEFVSKDSSVFNFQSQIGQKVKLAAILLLFILEPF